MPNAGLCRMLPKSPRRLVVGAISLIAIRHNRVDYRFFRKVRSSSSGRKRRPFRRWAWPSGVPAL